LSVSFKDNDDKTFQEILLTMAKGVSVLQYGSDDTMDHPCCFFFKMSLTVVNSKGWVCQVREWSMMHWSGVTDISEHLVGYEW